MRGIRAYLFGKFKNQTLMVYRPKVHDAKGTASCSSVCQEPTLPFVKLNIENCSVETPELP